MVMREKLISRKLDRIYKYFFGKIYVWRKGYKLLVRVKSVD